MLKTDFYAVEAVITQRIAIVRERRAKVQVEQGKIKHVDLYEDSDDGGYEESVEPLKMALKALRDSYLR